MTAQVADLLVANRVVLSLCSIPPIPLDQPAIVKLPTEDFRTDCQRGYVALWEIREDRLWLVQASHKYQLLGDQPIVADWVSGVLRLDQGALLDHVHQGFASRYQANLLIGVQDGRIGGRAQYTNRLGVYEEPIRGIQLRRLLPDGHKRFVDDLAVGPYHVAFVGLSGVKYCWQDSHASSDNWKQPVQLVREPDNAHDINAISVWRLEAKLGYIVTTRPTPSTAQPARAAG